MLNSQNKFVQNKLVYHVSDLKIDQDMELDSDDTEDEEVNQENDADDKLNRSLFSINKTKLSKSVSMMLNPKLTMPANQAENLGGDVNVIDNDGDLEFSSDDEDIVDPFFIIESDPEEDKKEIKKFFINLWEKKRLL